MLPVQGLSRGPCHGHGTSPVFPRGEKLQGLGETKDAACDDLRRHFSRNAARKAASPKLEKEVEQPSNSCCANESGEGSYNTFWEMSPLIHARASNWEGGAPRDRDFLLPL